MAKGLLCFVYRSPLGDATNNGLTSKHTSFVLVGHGVSGPFEANDDAPALHLHSFRGQLIAVPEQIGGQLGTDYLKGWMFGGNFIYTSDSRFPADAPIKVFDRREF
jgi:hypothetical protein